MHMFVAHPSAPSTGSSHFTEDSRLQESNRATTPLRFGAPFVSLPDPPPSEVETAGAPVTDPSARVDGRIIEGAIDLLRQGETLLVVLPDGTYTQTVPVAFGASIGGHYRHCLDHFANVLRGLDTRRIDYDDRERDRRLETDREFAVGYSRAIRLELQRILPDKLQDPVSVRCEISYRPGDSPVVESTLGRELVYAIAHGIHHYALISVMARLMNATLPTHFGVAPSTVDHRSITTK